MRLHEALAGLLLRRKGRDPLRPVTVVAPSGHAAVDLRRGLATAVPLANVTYTTWSHLQEDLAAQGGARAATAPPEMEREALRIASKDVPCFRGVLERAPALDVAQRTFEELLGCSEAAIGRMRRHDTRCAETIALFDGARELLRRAGYDDARSVADRALRAASAGDGTDRLGSLVLVDPCARTDRDHALLQALGRHLEVDSLETGTARPETSQIEQWVCADPDEEVHHVSDAVVQAVQAGAPLSRHLVLHPGGSRYATLLRHRFATLGLAVCGTPPPGLQTTAPGRLLLGLVDASLAGWRRDRVRRWWSTAPLRVRTRGERPEWRRAPTSRWDVLAAEAGVVASADQWRERLAALASDERWSTRPSRRLRAPDLASELDALGSLMEEVFELCAIQTRSWKGWADWAEQALDRLLDAGELGEAPTFAPGLGVDVTTICDAVTDLLDGLSRLDGLGGDGVTLAEFGRTLRSALEHRPLYPAPDLGDGVFVGSLEQARGMRADEVYVVGLADRVFPGTLAERSLLTESDRAEADDPALPVRAERLARRREDLEMALASAQRRCVLTAPRVDPRSGREQSPCRWWALLGGTRREFPSFSQAVLATPPGPDNVVLHHLATERSNGGDPSRCVAVRSDPILRRGFEAVHSRSSARLTRFDGYLGARAVVALDTEGAVSATRFEQYATCPRRYLFERVLDVEESPAPEDRFDIEPKERGSLVHRILERYVRGRLEGGVACWEELEQVAKEELDAARARGVTGADLFWRRECRAILRSLRRFFNEDSLTALAVELSFGEPGSAHPPVPVTLADGRTLLFRGRIDRVDKAPDGSLVVSDYKTGRERDLAGDVRSDPVAGGRRLQLPVYAMAARAIFPASPSPVRCRYWLVSAFPRPQGSAVGGSLTEAVIERFLQVVELIAQGVDAGAFPGVPGKPSGSPHGAAFEHCVSCPFDRVCPEDRDRQWLRKREAGAAGAVRRLMDAPVPATLQGLFVPEELARAVTDGGSRPRPHGPTLGRGQ